MTEALVGHFGYVGIALLLVLGGLGLPVPEEAPIILAAILSRLGLLGAVVGDPGYATPARFRAGPEGPFRILRFDLPESLPHVLQCTARIEHLKTLVLRKGA